MRGCFKAALAFGLVAILSAPAMAQGRGGFGGMGQGGVGNLVGRAEVQKELKMDTEQVEKANALAADLRGKMTDLRSQLDGLQGEEMVTKRTELMKPINEETTKKVKSFLKDDQYTRLTEIDLQQRGLTAFADPAIAKKLSITEDQKTKVAAMMTDMQADLRDIMQSAGDDRQAAQKKATELRAETTKKVMALMSADQKKTWEEMTGKPFTLAPMQRPAR